MQGLIWQLAQKPQASQGHKRCATPIRQGGLYMQPQVEEVHCICSLMCLITLGLRARRRFEHLVGELMIASAAKSGGDLNATQMRKLQVLLHLHCIMYCMASGCEQADLIDVYAYDLMLRNWFMWVSAVVQQRVAQLT